jgi:hypothetical protein
MNFEIVKDMMLIDLLLTKINSLFSKEKLLINCLIT